MREKQALGRRDSASLKKQRLHDIKDLYTSEMMNKPNGVSKKRLIALIEWNIGLTKPTASKYIDTLITLGIIDELNLLHEDWDMQIPPIDKTPIPKEDKPIELV